MHFYVCSLNFTLSALPFERRNFTGTAHDGSPSWEVLGETY